MGSSVLKLFIFSSTFDTTNTVLDTQNRMLNNMFDTNSAILGNTQNSIVNSIYNMF